MWDFLKFSSTLKPVFQTDLHSHLLPGIDDGAKSFEESAMVIKCMIDIGFTKAITTPHVISDAYRNTPAIIKAKAQELKAYLNANNIIFRIEAAAEYMLDEMVWDALNQNQELLTFSDNYILFETNTYDEPPLLNDFIFKLKVKNLIPVLAHPERYKYLLNNHERIEDLFERGVLFQVNALSLMGNYSKPIQRVARFLLDKRLIHFVGSDCHSQKHAIAIKNGIKNKYFQKALELPLLNYTI